MTWPTTLPWGSTPQEWESKDRFRLSPSTKRQPGGTVIGPYLKKVCDFLDGRRGAAF